jgi:hypothetical protein
MANAVEARWHGDDYQARVFWEAALGLLRPGSAINAVTFEADGPKAFDDVVVCFEPPIPRAGAERIRVDYMQVKWHVGSGGRFGFEELCSPDFISAKATSLLQRLADAVGKADAGSCFTFRTTDRITDGDPLADLVSGNDGALRLERLFDGTTDLSRMGKVRALWRTHLGLGSDHELRELLANFRIMEGSPNLDRMKSAVVMSGAAAGVDFDETTSDFRPDQLARQLKVRKLNRLDRPALLKFLKEESISVRDVSQTDGYHPVAVRSFMSASADIPDAAADDTLLLTDQFKGRYLLPGLDWRRDVEPRLESFLRSRVLVSSRLRLVIDGHASMAWLAGRVLDNKSGVTLELMQKGRPAPRRWRADDGAVGPPLVVREDVLSNKDAIAVAIGVAQEVDLDVANYVKTNLPDVGRIISFSPPRGPGHSAVAGGAHAVQLAEQIARDVRKAKRGIPRTPVHVFAACPNALLFYLGQNHETYAPSTMYEYDFQGHGNGTYSPSF